MYHTHCGDHCDYHRDDRLGGGEIANKTVSEGRHF